MLAVSSATTLLARSERGFPMVLLLRWTAPSAACVRSSRRSGYLNALREKWVVRPTRCSVPRSGPVEHAGRAQPALEVLLDGPGGQLVDLGGDRGRCLVEGLGQVAAQDATHEGQRVLAHRHPSPAGPAQRAAVGQVEGDERAGRSTR